MIEADPENYADLHYGFQKMCFSTHLSTQWLAVWETGSVISNQFFHPSHYTTVVLLINSSGGGKDIHVYSETKFTAKQ